MLEHPYILEAKYLAPRQDELGTIEIDGRRYRAVWSTAVRIGHLTRPSLRLALSALLRRRLSVRQPAATASR
jgi:hypothetical protein